MKREYWNRLADYYEDEVFDVLRHDRKQFVLRLLEKYGSSAKKATDYGCGIGRLLPSLCASFHQVIAIDISPKCIARAEDKCSHLANVKYLTLDLGESGVHLPKTHFGLSVNALIMPSLARRLRILDVMIKHVLEDGYLVLVVPALESAMFVNFRLIEWNLRDGLRPSSAVRAGFPGHKTRDNRRLHQGIILIDDVPTKHYLKEELVAILQHRKLRVQDIRKIEYSWKTEFISPPRWMKHPYPWDWIVLARKTE